MVLHEVRRVCMVLERRVYAFQKPCHGFVKGFPIAVDGFCVFLCSRLYGFIFHLHGVANVL